MPASSCTDMNTDFESGDFANSEPSSTEFSRHEKRQLLALARESISTQLHGGALPALSASSRLQQLDACFVTLKIRGELRGCIGSLTAYRPLEEDVIHNARAAARKDPRFSPLTIAELAQVEISISVLTPPKAFVVNSEAELLQILRPGIDGLLLEEGPYRATFLPAVWEQLPTPEEFLLHLKHKAGLPARHWSPSISFSRYRSIEFGERDV